MKTLALALLLAVLAGCSAEIDTKLGGAGEPCLSDNDCRLEFLCLEEVCDATHTCDPVCSRLAECGLETYETCAESCEENTASWTPREFESFEECFFQLDCNELGNEAESCFPD